MSIWIITNAIAAWLIPPGCLLLVAAWGLLCLRKHPRSAKVLLALAAAWPFVLFARFVEGAGPCHVIMCHPGAADDTPLANVMLTMLHRLGVDDLRSFGDSTGEFAFPTK